MGADVGWETENWALYMWENGFCGRDRLFSKDTGPWRMKMASWGLPEDITSGKSSSNSGVHGNRRETNITLNVWCSRCRGAMWKIVMKVRDRCWLSVWSLMQTGKIIENALELGIDDFPRQVHLQRWVVSDNKQTTVLCFSVWQSYFSAITKSSLHDWVKRFWIRACDNVWH